MDAKGLFLETVEDLYKSINSNNEYEILRASGLIRQLILDGDKSLVAKVNRQYRLKLWFKIVEPSPFPSEIPKPYIWLIIDGIDPLIAPEHLPVTEISCQRFLSTIVGIVQNCSYTVKDTIKFTAHVMGGIHYGEANEDTEKVLQKVLEFPIFSNINVPIRQIRAIGRILLEALKPLKYAVLGLERFESASGFSIHAILTLYPMLEGKKNYVLDIGSNETRNRASIFLDTQNALTLRVLDNSDGIEYKVNAGQTDYAYMFEKADYFSFNLAFLQEEILIEVEAGGWHNYRVIPKYSGFNLVEREFSFYVIGSDMTGKEETNIAMSEFCIFSRFLKNEERINLRNYFRTNDKKRLNVIRFEGNQYLYSQNHPNFQGKSSSANDLEKK